ncbi:MAG TPA: pentapeptide repeat-containing protein [Candidatus Cybelea sp.]|jgi:uncharacterized protein YjbI with pentapeptide repeats/beta-lactamase regulating signal transducer with metallopeptidase domain
MIVVAATVLNALWQDALLVLCVWLLLRAWPRINAATRYVVWSATLLAALVVPIVTTIAFFTPAHPVDDWMMSTNQHTSSTSSAHVSHSRVTGSQSRPPHASTLSSTTAPAPSLTRALPPLPGRLHVTLPMQVAIAVFVAWALLAGYALLGLLLGLRRLEQLKRDSLPLPVEYRDSMPQWTDANKGRRPVRLCVSEAIDVPVAVGLFDAMILIPRALLDRLSPEEVEQISLHELAHLRRADDWSNCLQRLIVAALGWNPAALFVAQQLELEREVACDDWVLSSVHAVRPYALCLTKMAETAAWPHHPTPAPGVFTSRKQISLRIERLLGKGRDIATNLAIGPAATAIATVTALALLIALVAPSVAAPNYEVMANDDMTTKAKPAAVAEHPAGAKPAASQKPVVITKTVFVPERSNVAQPSNVAQRPVVAEHAVRETHTNEAHLPALPAPPAPPAPGDTLGHATAQGLAAANGAAQAATKTADAGTAAAIGKSMDIARQSIADSSKMTNDINSSIANAIKKNLPSAGSARQLAQSGARSCVGCDLRGVNWAGRDLHGARYTGTDFSSANLSGANLSNSVLNGVDFSKANLNGVSFRGAHLTGCDFSNANLSGADFTGAAMSGCQFTGASLPSAVLRGIINACKGCDFTRANLSGADLSGVRLMSGDFSHADLRGANFAGADIVGTDFSNARLDGANFNGTTLNGCDLSGVDLSHVDLSRARLIGMDFSKPNRPR